MLLRLKDALKDNCGWCFDGAASASVSSRSKGENMRCVGPREGNCRGWARGQIKFHPLNPSPSLLRPVGVLPSEVSYNSSRRPRILMASAYVCTWYSYGGRIKGREGRRKSERFRAPGRHCRNKPNTEYWSAACS